jgi:tetratricopeptide (TPR) repeat protein
LDVLEGDPDEVAQRIQASGVREDIVAALDDWARAETDPQKTQRLLRLANLADEPDPWRQAVRQALLQRDVRRLRQLVRGTGEGKPTPRVLLLLAEQFPLKSNEPTALLRRMQLEQPRDFWVSFTLGNRLHEQKKHQEAAECYLVAVALRPDSAPALSNLGYTLRDKGKVEEAIACCQKAIAIDPKNAYAHNNLGNALSDKGKLNEAIACYKKAIALDPKNAKAHYNLGLAWKDKGKLDEAIACWRKAIARDPKYAHAHNNLGLALKDKGKLDEAIACYQKAIAIDPKYVDAHYNLGLAEKDKGQVDEAISEYRQAIARDPKYAMAHYNLGLALYGKGKLDEAIACYQKAIAIDPKNAYAHHNLGNALRDKGKLNEAIACYHKAIACDPKHANAHGALGEALMQQGQFIEAQKSLRRCLGLLPANHPLRGSTSRLLRQCEQLLELDGKLTAFLAGKQAPTDPASQVQMAALAQKPFKRLYVTSARLYRDAFARQPGLADAHRYHAACCAALAAAGQGKDAGDLPPMERLALRRQALTWLRAELGSWTRAVAAGEVGSRRLARILTPWQKDPNLAPVRDPAALARLPEAEQVAWRNLWAQVDALLARAKGNP